MHILTQQQIYYLALQILEDTQDEFVYKSSNAIWESLDIIIFLFFLKNLTVQDIFMMQRIFYLFFMMI